VAVAVHAITEHHCAQVTQVSTKVSAAVAVLTTDNLPQDKLKAAMQVQTQVVVVVVEMLADQETKLVDPVLLLCDIKEYKING
jgi:hypothetical protein